MKSRILALFASFVFGAAFAAPIASAHCGSCGVGEKKDGPHAHADSACCADDAKMSCCSDEACKKACADGHALKGKIVSIDTAKRMLVVKHDDIPGVMKAMTMGFGVQADLDLATLKAGDAIVGMMVKTEGKFTLFCVKKEPAKAM